MIFSPKVKVFLTRQAKQATLTALGALPIARWLDPSAFQFSNWHGEWHALVLIGGSVLSAEMVHVGLPLLAQLVSYVTGWAQSPTPDPLVQAVNTVADESKKAAIHADAAQSAAADVKAIVADTKASAEESKL